MNKLSQRGADLLIQREGLKAGENPRKLLNVGRVQKFLEERK